DAEGGVAAGLRPGRVDESELHGAAPGWVLLPLPPLRGRGGRLPAVDCVRRRAGCPEPSPASRGAPSVPGGAAIPAAPAGGGGRGARTGGKRGGGAGRGPPPDGGGGERPGAGGRPAAAAAGREAAFRRSQGGACE